MMYEIPKEAFKQRLEDKMNFAIINVQSKDKAAKIDLKDIVNVPYSGSFATDMEKQYSNKNQNILLFSLEKNDAAPATAASELAKAGYHFVYYYLGEPTDVLLDKGLN